MRKKIVIGVVILALIAAGGFLLFRGKNNAVQFRTEKASRGDIRQTVTATGTVSAVTSVLVGTQVSGMIRDLYVDYNSIVKKGQPLAQIDPSLFEAQLAQAMANLAVARANVERTAALLADAKRTFDRNKTLLSQNLIAKSDVDTAQTNYESNAAQHSASKSQVDQAKAALNTAEINLRYTRIVSPVNGMVISRNVDIGQTVAASFQTPTLFTIAQDLTKMQIDTSIDEADIGKIRVNQPTEFTVDAYPDMTFRGWASEVRNAPTTVQNVVTYDVVVIVDNKDLKLKPGMTANVSIITAAHTGVLMVPNAALRFRPPEKGESASRNSAETSAGPGVWVPAKDQPRRIKLLMGISDEHSTEVTGGEIREGDDIIVETVGAGKKVQAPPPPGFIGHR